MLRPFEGVHAPLDFAVYDLEWYPETYKLRLVGVYDGRRYRSYLTIAEFLDAELTSDTRGRILYAHAGGLSDVQFVLEEILKQGKEWSVEAAFSGSSAILVKATRADRTWVFADSYWLLKDALAKIGTSLGEEKGGDDYRCPSFPHCGHRVDSDDWRLPKCIFYAPIGLLRDYNALDCRILYKGIERFEQEILALGGSLRPTIASTAMRLFRSRFLRSPIRTNARVNEIARLAYIASRVEVFEEYLAGPAKYYDFNSSFPYSMTSACPGALKGSSRRWVEGDDLALVDATITAPACDVPPLPYRSQSGRILFPSGSWRSWFSGVDLGLLLESGGTIERVHRSLSFEARYDLAGYVAIIYELRRNEKDPFRRLVYKYLLNALYGKFGETPEKQSMLVNPSKLPPVAERIAAGIYLVPETVRIEHEHVPFAMTITARSRALLTRLLWSTKSRAYCDTDSIVTRDVLPTSDALGGLKEEESIEREAVFLAPKLYRLDDRIKAKGFPRLRLADFENLRAGGAIEIDRMLRLRELYRSGDTAPRGVKMKKRVWGSAQPKRRPLPGGGTAPWDVSEIT
jgi:hypothetical protein